MLARPIRSAVAVMTTVVFAVVLTLPCLCATAMAGEVDSGDEDKCCPMSKDSEPEEEPQDEQGDHDCCGGCAAACGEAHDMDRTEGEAGGLAQEREADSVSAGQSWWTPELLANLWLIDRLAGLETTSSPTYRFSHLYRPDRSATYLQHKTLLI